VLAESEAELKTWTGVLYSLGIGLARRIELSWAIMMRPSHILLLVAAGFPIGCGARTSDDDLLGYSENSENNESPDQGASRNLPGSMAQPPRMQLPQCCNSRSGTGCEETAIEECVCGLDPLCCRVGWDERCVELAQTSCNLSCEGLPPEGGGVGAPLPGTGASANFPSTGGLPGMVDEPFSGGSGGFIPMETGGTGGFIPTETGGTGSGDPLETGGTGSGGSDSNPFPPEEVERICKANYPDECSACRCSSCFSELLDCQDNQECVPLIVCASLSNCACSP